MKLNFYILLITIFSEISFSQTQTYSFLDSAGNVYNTEFPVIKREEIGTSYYQYTCKYRQVDYRDATDRFIVNKFNNRLLHKILNNESVFPNETDGLLIFEERYLNSTYSSEGEKLRNYEVYLTTIENPEKKTQKEKLYQYVSHDWVKNSEYNPQINGRKIAFNKKTNQLYVLSSNYDFKVYYINKEKKEVIKNVNTFKYDPKINEAYLEITFKNSEKQVYECKKMKKVNVPLEFPIKKVDIKEQNPLMQETEWTFENVGEVNTTDYYTTPKSIKKISHKLYEFIFEKSAYNNHKTINVDLVDLEKNKIFWKTDYHIYESNNAYTFYNKKIDKIYTIDPVRIMFYDLNLENNPYGSLLWGHKINGKEELFKDINNAFYNENLNQLYWYLPSSKECVIFNIENKKFKTIENVLEIYFDNKISSQHLLIKSKDKSSYYYDCKSYSNVGSILPENTPKEAPHKDELAYNFNHAFNKLTIYKNDKEITGLNLPYYNLKAVYIDEANKNILYYMKFNDLSINFASLSYEDSLLFEKNHKLLEDKKKLNTDLSVRNFNKTELSEFRKLNSLKRAEEKKFLSQKKWNYFATDTTNLFNVQNKKDFYPYQTQLPDNYKFMPFEEVGKFLNFPTHSGDANVFKLDEKNVLLSFGRSICLIDIETDSIKYFNFALKSSNDINFRQIKNELFLIDNKYLCNVIENRLLKKIVFKEGDFQLSISDDKYLYLAEAIDHSHIKLQQIDITNFEIINQDIIESRFFRKDLGAYSDIVPELTKFEFLDDKIKCYFSSYKQQDIIQFFNYSNNAIKKQLINERLRDSLLVIEKKKIHETDIYMSNIMRQTVFTYLFISYDEFYRYNFYSPDCKRDFDAHCCLDVRYKNQNKRYQLLKGGVVSGHSQAKLVPLKKIVYEKCTKCNGQKTFGGERSNCVKCSGSGFDSSKKCNARGCVYGYQSHDVFKVAVSAKDGAWATGTETTKKRCSSCLGTEKGLCSDCGGKGGKVSEIINCELCKGSGYINKIVDNN